MTETFPNLDFGEYVFSIYANKEGKIVEPSSLDYIISFSATQYKYESILEEGEEGEESQRSSPNVSASSIDFKNCEEGASKKVSGVLIGGTVNLANSNKAFCSVVNNTSSQQ